FADVQARQAAWKYVAEPTQYNFTQFNVEDMSWLFINPKVGARFIVNRANSVYLNAGMTSREPTRLDYLRDDLATRDIKQDELKPESVLDIEAGWNTSSKNLFLNTNLYYMQFQNQIANTGLLNAFGAPITQNTGSGTRMGIEIDGIYRLSPRWALTNSSSFSMNRIESFTQYFVIYDEAADSTYSGPATYTNTTPALSPAIIVNQGVRFTPFNYMTLDVNGRYVSRQYIDNTQTEGLSIPEYYVLDAALSLKLEQWTKVGEQSLSLRVNNITNTLYAPSGVIGGYSNTLTVANDGNKKVTTPAAYFPAATTNFFVTLMIKF
ncbi:MAG TPA: TonB-dependent receptor, partial [Bacteroidia bacterium]|nr:TonB-dependent receptor [Bacteroidia bacterium]